MSQEDFLRAQLAQAEAALEATKRVKEMAEYHYRQILRAQSGSVESAGERTGLWASRRPQDAAGVTMRICQLSSARKDSLWHYVRPLRGKW